MNYILENEADETGVISFLANSEENCLDIVENNPEISNPTRQSFFASGIDRYGKRVAETNLIWDSKKGVKFDEYGNPIFQMIFGGTGKRSPAEVLLHELGHAKSYFENPDQHFEDQGTRNMTYGTKEEADAIIRIENKAAKKLGGVTRPNHLSTFYNTKSSISTDEANN